jgi:hypothetical protein
MMNLRMYLLLVNLWMIIYLNLRGELLDLHIWRRGWMDRNTLIQILIKWYLINLCLMKMLLINLLR